MSVFNAHIPRAKFSPEQKRTLADALNHSLIQGASSPEGDRLIVLSEYGPDELFLYPPLGDTPDLTCAVIITAPVGSHRTLEDRHKLVVEINRLVVSAVGIPFDDIFITLVPVPGWNEPNAGRIWPWD
jgi:hypothetical protein